LALKTKKLRDVGRINAEMRMNNDSLDKSSNNRLNVSETSLDKLRDKVIRTTENENKKLEKLQKFENEYCKTIDNKIILKIMLSVTYKKIYLLARVNF
jgi:hypothetical protein